ncbi:MAG: class I SAM-dependent methyltransferase [Pseudomonadota bacterium]|nr:class I SAM-dependent methyltransferase [Pseudomonadota bacterium]
MMLKPRNYPPPTGFANPWEHVRLYSDAPRNEAMIALLTRRAPGARVVEVGCGTGLLSCVAARLGARHVVAIEPTPLAHVAAALVAANGLSAIVEVVHARVEDVAPRPVDLAFSELLNADPFAEGVLSAMDAVAPWVAPGPGGLAGRLAPRRLRVWAALARASSSAREARLARAQVRSIGARYRLATGALEACLDTPLAYVSVTATEVPAGLPVLAWDIALGTGARPAPLTLTLTADDPGPIAGVLLWFEAELDDHLVLANPPGNGGHWGQLLCAFAEERGLRAGGSLSVSLSVDGDHVTARIG